MGAPVFTEAELRRTLKVASEFGATVEVCPRRGVIRILAGDGEPREPMPIPQEDEGRCDEAFGL